MKKDQHVIACVDRPQDAPAVLACAKQCAERLNHKGLILLNVSRDGQADWIKDYGVPYIGLKGDWKTAIDGLPTAFGGILAVTAVDPGAPRTSLAHPSTLRRQFSECKSAYMVISSGVQGVQEVQGVQDNTKSRIHRRRTNVLYSLNSLSPCLHLINS